MGSDYYINKKQRIPVKCKICGHLQKIIIDTKDFKCSVCNNISENPAYSIIFNRIQMGIDNNGNN
jgi:ribosomal protein L37AE/L43A